MKSSAILATAFAAATSAVSVDPIISKGQHFFYKTNGTEFFIRGIAYQQNVGSNGTIVGSPSSYVDPLADPAGCARDIPYLLELRTNVVRVYAVDPSQNHDQCMDMLAEAGIYVISDLSSPVQAINRDDPSWNYDLYNRYTSVIDMFSKYTNVIGFFAGNEVANAANVSASAAFVKAAVRDMKAYIREQNYQDVGVGYATYDGPIRTELADYFACGPAEDAIDFWGYNIYSWCGDSNFVQSKYQARTEEFSTYPVPVFFAEYGCIQPPAPRQFTDVPVLYGPQMSGVWSGGIVYMYFQEVNDYGLVQVNGNTVTKLQDFDNLSSQIANVNPSSTAYSAYTQTNAVTPTCPSVGPNWMATATPLPPTPNEQLCNCMAESLSCVVANNVNELAYANIFNYICGADNSACAGFENNGTTGQYGAYCGCDSTQQLGWAMNSYYMDQSQSASACDFSGSATLVASSSATGACSSLLAAVGTAATGSVPTPTGGAQVGSASASSSTGAASSNYIPSTELPIISMSLYVMTAFFTGAGMLLL